VVVTQGDGGHGRRDVVLVHPDDDSAAASVVEKHKRRAVGAGADDGPLATVGADDRQSADAEFVERLGVFEWVGLVVAHRRYFGAMRN
jgi:hypothetical protein